MISCIITPYNIAFSSDENGKEPLQWRIINYTIDILFAIDIVIIFNSCYYDEDFMIIEDRKIIAKDYIQSWLIIDLVAILPLELILNTNNSSIEMVRIARMGRMYKMIKMAKILRVLKIIKQSS